MRLSTYVVASAIVCAVFVPAAAQSIEPSVPGVPSVATIPEADMLSTETARESFEPTLEMKYTPPPCEGLFPDVPCSNQFAPWIEQLYRDRITAGCGNGTYCPDANVTRGEVATLLERAVRGTERWPANTLFVWQVLAEDGSPDLAASGQALRDAIAAIPTTGPMASSSANPWVVRIGPGWFYLGDAPITVPEGVALRGAGRESTRIQKPGDSAVTLAGSNAVSDLYFQRLGYGGTVYGFVANADTFAVVTVFTNVHIYSLGGDDWNVGVMVTDGGLRVSNSNILLGFSDNNHAIYLGPGADRVEINYSVLWGDDGAIRSEIDQIRTVYLGYSSLEAAPIQLGVAPFRCAYNVTIIGYDPIACP